MSSIFFQSLTEFLYQFFSPTWPGLDFMLSVYLYEIETFILAQEGIVHGLWHKQRHRDRTKWVVIVGVSEVEGEIPRNGISVGSRSFL